MSRTAQWARVLAAASADLKAMPAAYNGMAREWLLGTLIAKIESAVMFRNIGMDDKADQVLAEAHAAIVRQNADLAVVRAAPTPDIRGRDAAMMRARGMRT